jgi:hypothetical protein
MRAPWWLGLGEGVGLREGRLGPVEEELCRCMGLQAVGDSLYCSTGVLFFAAAGSAVGGLGGAVVVCWIGACGIYELLGDAQPFGKDGVIWAFNELLSGCLDNGVWRLEV